MNLPSQSSNATFPGERVLHRIAWLTLGFGFAGALVGLTLRGVEWAEGFASGAVLSWLNFRWLRRGVRRIMGQAASLSTTPQADESAKEKESAASVATTYLAFLSRYALVALGVYVIFNYLHVPLNSIGAGLCAFIAAIMAASVWEVLKPES